MSAIRFLSDWWFTSYSGSSSRWSWMNSPKKLSSWSPTGWSSDSGCRVIFMMQRVSSIDRPAALGGLFDARLAAGLLHQFALGVADAAHRVDHVHRQADRAALIGDGPRDRLANPPGGVGAELIAAGVFELIDGPHQAGVAFLDQVEEAQAAVAVFLGDRDDQPQVAGREDALGGVVVVLQVGRCARCGRRAWRRFRG